MLNPLDFIFPKHCVGCGSFSAYFCQQCIKTIKLQEKRCPECDRLAIDGMTHPKCLHPYGLDGLLTVFRYEGVIKKGIKQLKYRFISDLVESFVHLVPQEVFNDLSLIMKNAMLYPIPLHRDRYKWRGFNQAEKLGIFVVRRLNTQMLDNLLSRSSKRIPQADIKHRGDRIKNAHGLFTPTTKLKASKLPSLIVFDDVWTTGATMKEVAKVLKKNGAKKIYGLTLAR